MTNRKHNNDVINFYEKKELQELMPKHPNPGFESHGLPLPFYGLICAQSGAGKSNLLLNIIQRSDNTYSHIYIVNQQREEIYEYLEKKVKKGLTIVQSLNDLPSFADLEKDKMNTKLFIFDDMNLVKNQDYIITMYKRGRKISASVLYLCQSYFATPIFIRKNIQFLFLLSISGKKDLKMILETFNDVEPEQLMAMYKVATKKHLDFFKIHTVCRDLNRKYAHNFLGYFQIE